MRYRFAHGVACADVSKGEDQKLSPIKRFIADFRENSSIRNPLLELPPVVKFTFVSGLWAGLKFFPPIESFIAAFRRDPSPLSARI